nr:MAG TPA: hypothetical protein [Caudoviricetes sp.]
MRFQMYMQYAGAGRYWMCRKCPCYSNRCLSGRLLCRFQLANYHTKRGYR